ncbi:ISM2 isoform 2 [Pan troglodytes]|uniref:ISM2 isoform 1 n=1 Tax=Pan troglodytes TaxID=9598 RepID=A0A2J8PKB3_PANTR|nr:ISM2 isoform 1 [Pan troglodytes]PNI84461.1 ISM2 isoform 2 [Pan troglodytes]
MELQTTGTRAGWPPGIGSSRILSATTMSLRRSGVPGLPAVGTAALASSRGVGPVAMAALSPRPVPVTCPPVLALRTRTPWASPVRSGSSWPTMLRTCMIKMWTAVRSG